MDSSINSDATMELTRPASTVWLPVTSLLIPGFGQLAQGRYVSGFSHAAAATSGLVLFAESGGYGYSMEDALFDIVTGRAEAFTGWEYCTREPDF